MSKFKETAAVDASIYFSRRRISAALGSSIRKLIRGNRIAAGLCPRQMPRKQTTVTQLFGFIFTDVVTLHPTKGFRVETFVKTA